MTLLEELTIAKELGFELRTVPGLPDDVFFITSSGGIAIVDLGKGITKSLTWREVREFYERRPELLPVLPSFS